MPVPCRGPGRRHGGVQRKIRNTRCSRSPAAKPIIPPSTKGSVWCEISRLLLHHISHAANGVEEFRLKVAIDFIPDTANVYFHEIRARIEAVIPNVFQDLGPSANASLAAKQVFEQPIFAGREIDSLSSSNNDARL